MSNEIHVTVRGNAAADPTLRYTESGTPWVAFRLGSAARRFDTRISDWTDGPTQWFNVKVFGRMAENVGRSLHKGFPVLVRGSLVSESWLTKEGQERTDMVITADSVALEMSRGITTYTRVAVEPRAQDETGSQPAEEDDAWASADDAAPEDADVGTVDELVEDQERAALV